MCLMNSYIFILKNQEEKAQSVNEYIRNLFFVTDTKPMRNGLFRKDIFCDVNLPNDENKIYKAVFSVSNVGEQTYLDVKINENNMVKSIECITYINEKLMKSDDINKEYIMVISYDAVSEYYCNKAYPILNQLERNLRNLLFHTYVSKFGGKYYETTFDKNTQDSVKEIIKAKGNDKKKSEEYIKRFFYSMDFFTIQKILFDEKTTELDKKNINDFLSVNKDLSVLSDEKLRQAFESLYPISDWERFFSSKIPLENIKVIIKDVGSLRNDIAHCKLFYEVEYTKFKDLVAQLNKSIFTAIEITQKEDFAKINEDFLDCATDEFFIKFDTLNKLREELLSSFVDNIVPDFARSTVMAGCTNLTSGCSGVCGGIQNTVKCDIMKNEAQGILKGIHTPKVSNPASEIQKTVKNILGKD